LENKKEEESVWKEEGKLTMLVMLEIRWAEELGFLRSKLDWGLDFLERN
jgi:hypothetical protein